MAAPTSAYVNRVPPTVSVVIPTHDRAHVIRRAVSSVQAQSLADWELIVVDDGGGDDDTAAVIAGLCDDRIRYVRRKCNGGVAAAQNTGLDHARGEFVAFLHSDDAWRFDRLATLVPQLCAAGPDIGGIESGLATVEQSGITVKGPYLKGATDTDLLGYRAGVHVSTLLLRRSVLQAVRFDESLRHVEDRDLCIRLLRHTRLIFDDEPLVTIHREQTGLRNANKAPTYEYLLGKYRDELEFDPRLHGAWWSRVTRAALKAGDFPTARRAARRAAAVHPSRLRRWIPAAASYLSDRAFGAVERGYLTAARLLQR